MSEQTSKVFVTPHNQAFAKGDVLKINGLYWRVLGCQDDKPYAKLLLLGSHSKAGPFIPGVGDYRFPHAFQSEFSYTDPATGSLMINAYVPYYSKDETIKDTYPHSADAGCVKWANEQDFSRYLETAACPPHKVYRVVSSIVTSQAPDLVIKSNTTSNKSYIVPVGLSDQTGISRKCRLLSIKDIVEYFDGREITPKILYEDLLGGKHGYDATHWRVNGGGWLYDAIKYPYNPDQDSGVLKGLGLYDTGDRPTVEPYGTSVVEGNMSGDAGGGLLVINLNLRAYRNWEKASDW